MGCDDRREGKGYVGGNFVYFINWGKQYNKENYNRVLNVNLLYY